MEKMKNAYEAKINFLEEKIEHMIAIKRERSASSSSMTSMMGSSRKRADSTDLIVKNIVIKKEKEEPKLLSFLKQDKI